MRIILGALATLLSFGTAWAADGITLDVSPGPAAGDAELSWSGAAPPFRVYRSPIPNPVEAPSNLIGSTNLLTWMDSEVPPAGGFLFYLVIQGTCGDGIIDQGEDCDGSNLGGETCQRLGYSGGTLQCAGTCVFDETLCGGPNPAHVTLSPMSWSFGSVVLGATSLTKTFVVGNDGDSPTGGLSIALGGADPSQFQILQPTGGDCTAGSQLAAGTTCTVRVQFAPSIRGAHAASLDISANPGSSASAALTGSGLAPAMLTGAPPTMSFGAVFVGSTSAQQHFVVTNAGDLTTGTISSSTSGAAGEFVLTNPCSGAALAGGASCTVDVGFAPTTPGDKTATLTLSAAPGGSAQLSISGVGVWPMTFSRQGTGVITRDGVATCAGTCSETTGHADGSMVTFMAQPQNGSGFYFGGWGGACAGIERTCVVSMTQARSVTATFTAINRDLAFVSSVTYPATLGGTAAYDNRCNQLATAAGINSIGGNNYIAWISDLNTLAGTRLGTARGWIRLDGKPVADSQTSLLTSNTIFHPLRIDENGVDVRASSVFTGTSSSGSLGMHCTNWTSTAGFGTAGNSAQGPGGWTASTTPACSTVGRIYCLMKTSMTTLTITPEAGKRVFLSGTFAPGATTPDQRCTLDKPAGVGAVRALIATSTASASAVLNSSTRYVRPDGIFVGTGADLIGGGLLTSGIWQSSLAYVANSSVWTGHTNLTGIPSISTTCGDWSSSTGSTIIGFDPSTDTTWWNFVSPPCTSAGVRLYCVEQ